MGIRKFISNLFAPDEEKKKKPAGTTSQASAASTGNRAVGKTVVKTPAAGTAEKKSETKTKKSGTSTKKSGTDTTKSGTDTTKSDAAKAKSETKKSTDGRRTVAVGKTTVELPTEQQKKNAKSPISEEWNKRKETVAQKQVQQVQDRKSKTVSNLGILDKWNSAQKERNAARQAEEQAQKNRKNQMQLLSDAAGSYEARLKAIADRASRAPESITQEDVNAYNDLWTRYQQTLGNYAKAKGEQDAEEQLRKTQKKSAQQQILAAMGAGSTMQGATGQQNNTIFDVDPRQQIINAQIVGQGAQAAAQQRAQQLPGTLAAIGLGGIAAAQDTVGTAMGMGEQAAWALSPGAQQDAAQRADHARQVAAWKQENRDAQKKMEKAFELTENDALGQFLVELNYNFVQQGISTVAGGIFGKAGGTALSALGKEASAAGGNLAGQIGSRAAQRAAASAQVGGKALQGAARYLQKNAPLATMATLAGANNYQAAIGGGANEGQAMAYAVLTGAAEAVTEKLFGGNPLMDNEAGWVNRALYKMLGDRKFLKALESVPVETFNEGFEEVIANYLYSAAQAATGQQVELPSTEENLHSFALGAAMGGMGQAAKLAGNAMRQRSADIETGELMQRMGAGDELIAAGLALPGSRAEMHATELRLRNQQPTARELGRQYRENVRAQELLTAKQMETENTVRRMAENVGAQVAFDATISDAAGHDSAADGYYKDNVLHIARDADKPAMTVAVHEITHYLQQAAPEQYRTFRAYAMRLQGKGAVQAMQERYARGGVELTEEEAMDEIAASTAEKLLTDRGSIESLIRENPSVAQRFFDALREFIRKLAGRVDPQLRQAEKLWTEAYQAAKGSKNAAPEGGKAQYLMAGRNARGADLDALNRAVEMQRDGAKMEDIRKETGWFTGADGKWRFEIDDSGMEYYRMNERIGSDSATLENIIDHEELFRAYPQLRQAKVRFEDLPGGTKGQYDRESNTIRIDQSLRKAPEDTLVHEIQHAIQSAEGFAGGSSPEYWAARDYETGEVKKRMRMERRNEFRQLSKEDQNKYTRYKELEREMDRLESAEDGTEDADRYVKYERESDALYLELWGKPWFQKLVTLDRKLESGLGEEYNRLYRNTAGEIEARDVSARRKLTAEQRRETAPNTGDENTVFVSAPGGQFEMSEEETKTAHNAVLDKVEKAKDRIAKRGIIKELSGKEFAEVYSRRDIVDAVTEYFDSLGGSVTRPGFGEVLISKRGAKDSMAHGYGEKKKVSFAAVPDVIRDGVQIDFQTKWKGRPVDSYIFAGEVLVDGEVHDMGVVVLKSPQNSRFYLHEIMEMKKDDRTASFQTGAIQEGRLPGDAGSSLSESIISKEGENGKKKFSLKEASADEGYWDDLSYRRYDESSPMSRAGYAMMADDAYSVETYGEKLVAVRQSELRPISEFQDQIAEAWERDKENGMLPAELEKYHADMSGEEVAAEFDPEDIVMSADAWDNEDMVMWAYEKVFDGVPGVKTRDGAIVFDENLLHRLDTDSDVLGSELHNQPKYALKKDGEDLKTMRAERSDVRREIDKLEWLEEKQGYLDETDAAAMKQLRAREKDLTERIDVANAAAKENRGTEAEHIMQKAKGEAAAAQPTQARKTLRQDLLDTFSVQAGRRKELGQAIDKVAERVRKQGYATASDGAELFRGLYNAGVVVDTTESEHYAEIRRTLRGVKLHIDETVRAELGDDFTRTRQEAFRNGIILTTKDGEGVGIDVEHKKMAELFPGVFDNYNTAQAAQLEDMIRAAELGRPEHISLMEQAMRAGGEDAVAQQMTFFDRYLTNALENYAKQAGFEVRVKQGEIMKAAKARAIAADAWEKQSQRKAMAEAQNRTLKVFQRLRRMKKDQSAETKALIDEIVGNFDTMAKTLRKDKEATWRDMRKIYDEARKDPNFLPREDWEQKFSRLDAARVGELSREDALDLYKRGVELIHMIRTKDKEIAEENARELDDLYHNSVQEIETSDGDKWKFNRKGEAKKKLSSNRFVRKYWDGEQLSPMNMIEKMGGWRRDGAFYSMAKQLERGEYDKQRYIIQSDALLKDFTEKHEKWIAKADGKGKDAIWYEVEVPAFLEAGNGGADLWENKSVKIYMTPMMKVKLYLDSLNYDNLWHIKYGGVKFPDRRIYSAAKKEEDELEAYANGVTVKMKPGFVKSLVADLTPEEKELAFILGKKYFNGYAKEEINRVSNLLDGHDKAMNDNYSPIYTDANYLGNKMDPAIVDATIEGMGPLKNRVKSGTPVLAVSALSAFQKNRDMTAKYVGLAIPVRNMNALLNYTEKGYNDSMRAVIGKKWGDEAVKYLDDLMKNIQNKPADELNVVEQMVKWTTNNYVKAVFGFNPGTVIKQAPGFFMAGARLGFDTIPATSMLHSAWGKYRDLIAKYTPIMEWRARGYSTREMSELKNNPSWTQRNRAFKFVFGGAIQWMDLHTCAAIWPWAENYVKKHYPNLKPGSRSEINSGKDAYYKKVAEVFEDAIANSQPMYDDMHTAKIMHSNNGIARGITMFHTAQLTQANAIRQAHGEMKRAQAENDKEGLKRGQKAFKDSIMALLISTLSFEAVGALVAIAKRKDKALRDDEGEMTPATIAKYMADATAKDLLGNVVGWDTAYDIGTHFLFGNTWYGFEMPGADAIQDFIDDAAKWKKAAAEFGGGIFNVTDAGDFQYYLRTAGSDFRKASKNAAVDLSYLLGVPAKNMESYTLGLMGWINPDLAAAYNNAWGGSYDKSSVAALGGKPKEQEAAIRKAVRNRAKDASDEAVAELQRLYQTAGTEVMPQAVADTITIETGEDSSEKVELSLKQKSDYQKAYDKVVSAELNQLIASPEYAKLSDDQKAGAVVLLYKYAAEQGKQAAVAEYAPKGWKAKAASAAEEGADVYQTVIYKAATEEIEGDKDENGDTISGSEAKKKMEWLIGSGWSETTQAAIYFAEIAQKNRDEKSNELAKKGVSRAEYYRYMVQTRDTTGDKDENGETISGTENKNLYDKLNAMDLSDEQKGLLYFAEIQDYTKDDKYYPKAKAEGVSDWQYASFKANTGVMVSDKDKNGKSITDSKRDKVLGYINGMDISSDAKDELYFAAGYGAKRLSEAPWHSGKKSSKKAQKAAKKQTAARAALATPEMQSYLQKYGVTQANGRPATAADLQSSVERYIRKYTGGRSLPRAGESMNLPSDLPRAGEALTTRDLPRAGEEVQMQSLPTYNDLVNRREKESLDEKYFRKFGRR
nr:MAG TPA: Large polyvalent protein associated domain 23 [Caudoviricetes sp.]